MKQRYLFILMSMCFIAVSQEPLLHCGTDELRISSLKQNPAIAKAVIKRDAVLEAFTKNYSNTVHNKKISSSATYIIPVVVNVIHNYGTENISDAQIKDGIDILNKTFRKQRTDTNQVVQAFKGIHADCDIEFRLATRDPNGNCHSGINRIASLLTNGGQHNVKALVHWPPQQYLNIYVVASIPNLAGHCVLPADADTIPAWDGIVIGHNYMGTIGTSSPLTSVALAHECGHYLNLQHIWGGNNVPNFYYYPCADPNKDCSVDDLVADTPPTIGWQSCNLSGASCGNVVDNVQNAMDYSYCNMMFTQGQKTRMQACLNSSIAGRNNLWQTSNLIATGVYSTAPICAADFTANKVIICPTNQVLFTNTSYAPASITSYTWNFQGGNPATTSVANPTVTYANSGTYSVSLSISDGTTTITKAKQQFISVQTTTGSAYPFYEGFETWNSLINSDWITNNLDSSKTWEITNSASATGAKSTMIDNFNSSIDGKDELYSRAINLTGATTLNVSFKYAFARKDTSNKDQLQLWAINNCNGTLFSRFNAIGGALETTSITSTAFYPTTNEWKEVSATLPSFLFTTGFRLKFAFSRHAGNNVFIDDINIAVNAGINNLEQQLTDVDLFPNPSNGNVFMKFNNDIAKTLSITIYNVLGEKVAMLKNNLYTAGAHQLHLPTNELSSGLYYVQLSDAVTSINKTLVIVK